MPLIPPTHDSLPYIDADPSPSQRAVAESLIQSEMYDEQDTSAHPLLPAPVEENYTPIALSEFSRIEAKIPISGVDSSRYESLAAPEDGAETEEWRDALAKAYTSQIYLSNRRQNLETLEKDGKEEWLAGNEALVEELQSLEKELARTKESIDLTAVERRNRQESVRGEMEALEIAWKRGVGRVLETEVAAEGIRQQILAARRSAA